MEYGNIENVSWVLTTVLTAPCNNILRENYILLCKVCNICSTFYSNNINYVLFYMIIYKIGHSNLNTNM